LSEHKRFSYGLEKRDKKNYVQLSFEAGVDTSAVREILSIAQGRPDLISLAGGLPDSDLFATEQFLEILSDYTHGKISNFKGKTIKPGWLYQYSPTEGVSHFIETLLKWIEEKEDFGPLEKENLLVVSAAQQGLDIAARALIDPCHKGTVIVGNPTYLAELNVLQGTSGNLEPIGIPLDEKGMQVDLIHEIPKEKLEMCKYIYVVPTFDNPAGTELSKSRRKELINISNEYGIPIIEDEPYACLRYEGKKLHSVKHYDDIDCVLRVQTFSKMAAPGLRLGYVAGSKEFIAKMRVMLQNAALCSSALSQYLMAEFINSGAMEEYWKKVIPIYRERRNAMLESMDLHLKPYGSWIKSKGGLFVWLKLNDINGDDLFRTAIEKNVAIVKGSAFIPPGADGKMHNSARLNFSKPTSEQIREGIKRLSLACEELSKK